jgi:hypothetical protein
MAARSRRAWTVLLMLALGGIAAARAADASAVGGADDLEVGRALYLDGRRASGAPLLARRDGGLVVAGTQAACVNCHRRSGLGGAEGRSYIPPVTAAALLRKLPPGKGPSATGRGRPAYTPATLLRALHAGVDPAGRMLDYLMPRYELADREVRGLLRYLGTLPSEGVRPDETGPLHFATVFTPGVPAPRKRAMLDVLQACFSDHNAGPTAERGRRKLALDMSLRRPRAWELHVWELRGAESTWDAQLANYARERPVFAVVGGVGAGAWSPVHGFCERSSLPCLFPHLELPIDDPGAFYPLYLSKGVLLEAGLVAQHLARSPPGARVVQVARETDRAAMSAAQALRQVLDRQQVEHHMLVLPGNADSPAQLPAASSGAPDSLVLWLRPGDLERLPAPPASAAQVFVSATLAGQDAVPLPPGWKARALMAYPFELPQVRLARMQRMTAWFRNQGLVLEDERVQADAYVACTALRAGMQDSEGHPGRDYLLEKIEANIERWPAPGVYPRLALGPGQRFASKSGYVVRLDADSGQLAPVGERSAP